jgi:hypothetical protein
MPVDIRGCTASGQHTTGLDHAFADVAGVASFIRQMSGGRQYVEWQVFGPVQLMTIAQKQKLDSLGFGQLIPGLRAAAKSQGIPVDTFDRVIWVFDDGVSNSATSPNDTLIGAQTFVPSFLEHELVHTFGVCSHADANTQDDYGNPYCIMGNNYTAYGININIGSGGASAFVETGPGLTAPYLYTANWLDPKNIFSLPDPPTATNVQLSPNRGAPSAGSTEMTAATVGNLPKSPGDPTQTWFEFRIPTDFDRAIMRGVSPGGGAGSPGVLLAHQVTAKNTRCVNRPWSMLAAAVAVDPGISIGPIGGVTATITGQPTRAGISLSITPD